MLNTYLPKNIPDIPDRGHAATANRTFGTPASIHCEFPTAGGRSLERVFNRVYQARGRTPTTDLDSTDMCPVERLVASIVLPETSASPVHSIYGSGMFRAMRGRAPTYLQSSLIYARASFKIPHLTGCRSYASSSEH